VRDLERALADTFDRKGVAVVGTRECACECARVRMQSTVIVAAEYAGFAPLSTTATAMAISVTQIRRLLCIFVLP
jgi:hypothetical protein